MLTAHQRKRRVASTASAQKSLQMVRAAKHYCTTRCKIKNCSNLQVRNDLSKKRARVCLGGSTALKEERRVQGGKPHKQVVARDRVIKIKSKQGDVNCRCCNCSMK